MSRDRRETCTRATAGADFECGRSSACAAGGRSRLPKVGNWPQRPEVVAGPRAPPFRVVPTERSRARAREHRRPPAVETVRARAREGRRRGVGAIVGERARRRLRIPGIESVWEAAARAGPAVGHQATARPATPSTRWATAAGSSGAAVVSGPAAAPSRSAWRGGGVAAEEFGEGSGSAFSVSAGSGVQRAAAGVAGAPSARVPRRGTSRGRRGSASPAGDLGAAPPPGRAPRRALTGPGLEYGRRLRHNSLGRGLGPFYGQDIALPLARSEKLFKVLCYSRGRKTGGRVGLVPRKSTAFALVSHRLANALGVDSCASCGPLVTTLATTGCVPQPAPAYELALSLPRRHSAPTEWRCAAGAAAWCTSRPTAV